MCFSSSIALLTEIFSSAVSILLVIYYFAVVNSISPLVNHINCAHVQYWQVESKRSHFHSEMFSRNPLLYWWNPSIFHMFPQFSTFSHSFPHFCHIFPQFSTFLPHFSQFFHIFQPSPMAFSMAFPNLRRDPFTAHTRAPGGFGLATCLFVLQFHLLKVPRVPGSLGAWAFLVKRWLMFTIGKTIVMYHNIILVISVRWQKNNTYIDGP